MRQAPLKDDADIDRLRESLKNARGPGNFRNLFYYAPGGKADGMKLIPVAEVMAKDEFLNIKNVTRDDPLAAHRTPPQIMGVVPANTGGLAIRSARPRCSRPMSWCRCRPGFWK